MAALSVAPESRAVVRLIAKDLGGAKKIASVTTSFEYDVKQKVKDCVKTKGLSLKK